MCVAGKLLLQEAVTPGYVLVHGGGALRSPAAPTWLWR